MKHLVLFIHLLVIISSIYELETAESLASVVEIKLYILAAVSFAVISLITALGGGKK